MNGRVAHALAAVNIQRSQVRVLPPLPRKGEGSVIRFPFFFLRVPFRVVGLSGQACALFPLRCRN